MLDKYELLNIVDNEIEERLATMSESGEGEYDTSEEVEELRTIKSLITKEEPLNQDEYVWLCDLAVTYALTQQEI